MAANNIVNARRLVNRLLHPEIAALFIKPQTSGRFQQVQAKHRSGEDVQV